MKIRPLIIVALLAPALFACKKEKLEKQKERSEYYSPLYGVNVAHGLYNENFEQIDSNTYDLNVQKDSANYGAPVALFYKNFEAIAGSLIVDDAITTARFESQQKHIVDTVINWSIANYSNNSFALIYERQQFTATDTVFDMLRNKQVLPGENYIAGKTILFFDRY